MERTIAVAALILLAANLDPAVAQPPAPNEKSEAFANRLFIPRAGYADLAYKAHLARRAQERGRAQFAPGQPLSVTGTRAVPAICVEFKNVAAPFEVDNYEQLLFGADRDSSLTSYYLDLSQGQLTVTGRATGWYKAPEDDTYYENGRQGDGPPFGELLEFALSSADQDLDFSQFDNNGPDGIPNSGDDDGIVDMVFIIHPEYGAECDRGTNIWSHSWHYSEQGFGHSGPFETNDIRRDKNGHAIGRIVIEDYTIQPGRACGSTAERQIIEVGVFCHEFGHALGLPDFYDRTPSPNADSSGLGHWCLMASGNQGGDGKHSDWPTRMSAWGVYYLGWANLQTFSSNAAIELDPAFQRNDMYRMIVPGTNNLEYFLVEYRKNGPGPPGQRNWDRFLPISGLAVWHVDERVGGGHAGWPFSDPDKGQNDSAVRLHPFPPPLFKSKHPLIALVQKDGLMHLEAVRSQERNRGDAGDLFVNGDVLSDDPTGKAGTRGYDSQATGIAIQQIKVTPNEVTGDLVVAAPPGGAPRFLIAAPPVPPQTPAIAPATTARLKAISAKLGVQLRPQARDVFAQKSSRELPMPALNAKELQAIKSLDPATIEQAVNSKNVQPAAADSIWRLSAQVRTRRVDADSTTTDAVTGAAKRLAARSSDGKSAKLFYAADGQSVAGIDGLMLKSTKTTPASDALDRLNNDPDVSVLVGTDAIFTPMTDDATSRTQVFQQTVLHRGRQLPIWKADCTFKYDDSDNLVEISSNVVQEPQKILAVADEANERQALESAAEALALPADSLKVRGLGIYLSASEPSTEKVGRIAYQIDGPSGPGDRPLTVFLDAGTKMVLEIK